MSPIHYTWINATCHKEALNYFNVDPTMLPTVVFMHISKNRHSLMEGKFDRDSLREHEHRFKLGKVPLKNA